MTRTVLCPTLRLSWTRSKDLQNCRVFDLHLVASPLSSSGVKGGISSFHLFSFELCRKGQNFQNFNLCHAHGSTAYSFIPCCKRSIDRLRTFIPLAYQAVRVHISGTSINIFISHVVQRGNFVSQEENEAGLTSSVGPCNTFGQGIRYTLIVQEINSERKLKYFFA